MPRRSRARRSEQSRAPPNRSARDAPSRQEERNPGGEGGPADDVRGDGDLSEGGGVAVEAVDLRRGGLGARAVGARLSPSVRLPCARIVRATPVASPTPPTAIAVMGSHDDPLDPLLAVSGPSGGGAEGAGAAGAGTGAGFAGAVAATTGDGAASVTLTIWFFAPSRIVAVRFTVTAPLANTNGAGTRGSSPPRRRRASSPAAGRRPSPARRVEGIGAGPVLRGEDHRRKVPLHAVEEAGAVALDDTRQVEQAHRRNCSRASSSLCSSRSVCPSRRRPGRRPCRPRRRGRRSSGGPP